ATGHAPRTTTRAQSLCPPVNVDQAPSSASLDRFKCYRERPRAAAAPFTRRRVALMDGFEGKATVVLKPVAFCTAVDEDGRGFRNPAAALGCYRIHDACRQPRFVRRGYAVDGEFGSETATVTRGRVLRVPSTGS